MGKEKENMSGWEISGTLLNAAGLATDLTRTGVNGAFVLANTSSTANTLKELSFLKGVSKYLGYESIVISAVQIFSEGLNYNNGTDAVFGIIALIPGPGWIIGGIYFIGNAVLKHQTGQSVGDLIYNLSNFEVIGGDGNVIGTDHHDNKHR